MTYAVLANGLFVERGGKELMRLDELALNAGEVLAVVGPNGAGKSTLLRALTGEWRSAGELLLWGKPLTNWSRVELAQHMAVMPQQSHLQFDFSVREVVELGRLPHRHQTPAANRAAVQDVLDLLGLHVFEGRRFTSLSGGERQRVQFGRVLAQIWKVPHPNLLLLDEPTSALDLAQQKQVLDLAREQAASGCAVLAVLHDLNLAARYAHRILVLKNGRMAHFGTPESVLTNDMLQFAFGVEAQVERARCDGRPVVVVEAGV